MVKSRMGLLDLRVQTATLHNSLRGARVTNVYDAQNGRTYVLKLSVPPPRVQRETGQPCEALAASSSKLDSSSPTASSWEKKLLLLESGVRLHMTEFDREKDVPSGFCLKLRKHIRTRRLDAVRQLGDGGDRILDLVFSGEGQVCAHLIVEAFSGGNVILTDGDYTILTMLRSYRIAPNAGEALVAVRKSYPVENARRLPKIDREVFREAAKRSLANMPDEKTISAAASKAARKRLQAKTVARKALAIELAIEPSLLEHALWEAALDVDVSVEEFCTGDSIDRTFQSLEELESTISALLDRGGMKGYIVSTVVEKDGEKKEQYDEFAPFLFAQYRHRAYKEFETFDQAADEFFSSLEAKRAETAQLKREAAAFKKVDKLASELKGQVAVFENARDISWEKAQAIEGNIVEVEAAITVIRSAIAASVSWNDLAKMVEDEKKNGNPVAEIIHSLQLERNKITLMLEDTFGDGDGREEENHGDGEQRDDDEGSSDGGLNETDINSTSGTRKNFLESSAGTRKVLLVSVDLELGAHANARRHYEQRKSAAAKLEKAAEATDRTLKAATKRAVNDAQRMEAEAVAASIRARRKALWFEKFYWFVSSENYLIVAGRDAQQNELLVKRYLGPADVYVHADISGASSVIVKNRKLPGARAHAEVPQMTLEQAGTFAMCRSAAWDAKIVSSAWWVRASQVSKTAPSGEYLPVGSLAIRGKKHFLSPTQLTMGLAFLFKVDESSKANHEGERTVRGMELLETMKADEQTEGSGKVKIPRIPQRGVLSSSDSPGADGVVSDRVSDRSTENEENSSSEHTDNDSTDTKPATSGTTGASEETAADVHDEEAVSNDIEEEADSGKVPKARKRHLSAKQRRALRSARGSGDREAEGDHEKQMEGSESNALSKAPQKQGKTGSAPKNNAPLPRGRKHKLKKMKKYKDQDDEERRIALTVLGSKPVKELDSALQHSGDTGNEDGQNEEEEQERGTRTRRFRDRRDERHEAMRLLDEEGIIELSRLEEETVVLLDMLTAAPISEDVVQYALPVCAPYSALSNYRYKVKMMPGSTKRGKAYRSAVVLFVRQAERNLEKQKQERDAMRLSPENDGIHGMLGNVKVMAPGLAEAQKSIQKNKKNVGAKKRKQNS